MLYYTVRTSIRESVKEEAKKFEGTILDVGCGLMPYRHIIESNHKVTKYIGMDLEDSAIYREIKPELTWNGAKIPLKDKSIDCVMATELLEHLANPELVLTEVLRVLKPDGKFFATVPFIWNLHEIPYDEYRYTPFSLERLLSNAGFQNINVKALGGWNVALAQMIGLWVNMSKMGSFKRSVLRRLLFPFYVWLVKTDERPAMFDGCDNSMFSGLSVSAIARHS